MRQLKIIAHTEQRKKMRNRLFFSKGRLTSEIAANCRICATSKHDRHPRKQEIGKTPIPSYAGEMLRIDVYSTAGKYFLTCIDKFSKFAVVQPIRSRAIEDIKAPLLQLLNIFPKTKAIYCDNEKSLNSETINSMLSNGIEISNAPPLHSSSNGQAERFHDTLGDIARFYKLQ